MSVRRRLRIGRGRPHDAADKHAVTPGGTGWRRDRGVRLTVRAYQTVERVNRDDAQWFYENPQAQRRVRPYVEGEAWPIAVPPEVRWVIIERVGTNRVRFFCESNPVEREQQEAVR